MGTVRTYNTNLHLEGAISPRTGARHSPYGLRTGTVPTDCGQAQGAVPTEIANLLYDYNELCLFFLLP